MGSQPRSQTDRATNTDTSGAPITLPLGGRCTCGAVRYCVAVEPLFVHCCHCTWCQRETGSAFVLNALVERREVDVTGALLEVALPSSSGQGQRVLRCSACRVALWSHYAFGGVGDQVAFLRVGTLDEPGRLRPDVHIFASSKLPWVELGDEVPVFEEYYRAEELWPAASLARRRALQEAGREGAAPSREDGEERT